MKFLKLSLIALLGVVALAQAPLDNTKLLQMPTDSWPMFNGDYSGRRFSPLKKINSTNINSLTLAWMYRATAGNGGNVQLKSTPLADQWGAVFLGSGPCLGGGCADRPGDLALYVAFEGRDSYWKSRRGCVRKLAVFRDA